MILRAQMRLFLVLLAVTAPAGAAQAPATASAPAAASVSAEEVRRAIRNLNHPSITQRRAAIRQLAEWGPVIFPDLRRAASSSDLEAALSARDLLTELESAIFLGARVRLEVSRQRVRWDEPFSLTVIATNTTPGPLRVPWPAPTAPVSTVRDAPPEPGARGRQPASRPAFTDAEQVAAMMDVADFLVVTGPDGRAIELRVEGIERDAAVYAAVDQRARDNPPSHQIGAGQEARLTIPHFNRGWARFPLLRAGTYQIAFAYQPQWKDESWTKDGFGQVRAEPVTITVTDSAPDNVLRGETALELQVRRAGDETIEAVFISHWDAPTWVNLNLSGPAATHARLEWQLVPLHQDERDAIDLASSSTPPGFELQRVVRIGPGDEHVAARLEISRVREGLEALPDGRPSAYALQARYAQLATSAQLRDELIQLGKPHDVPVHLFSGAVISPEVKLDALLPQ